MRGIALELPSYFYLFMEKALGCYFQGSTGSTVEPGNTYSYIFQVPGQV